jgi:hypothetical protein
VRCKPLCIAVDIAIRNCRLVCRIGWDCAALPILLLVAMWSWCIGLQSKSLFQLIKEWIHKTIIIPYVNEVRWFLFVACFMIQAVSERVGCSRKPQSSRPAVWDSNTVPTHLDVLSCILVMKSASNLEVSGYWLDDRRVGVLVPIGSKFFSSPYRPCWLRGPPNDLHSGYRRLFPRG